jgi:hypothetical protein
MHNHKEETIAAAMRVTQVSRSVATINHQELMPVLNPTGLAHCTRRRKRLGDRR